LRSRKNSIAVAAREIRGEDFARGHAPFERQLRRVDSISLMPVGISTLMRLASSDRSLVAGSSHSPARRAAGRFDRQHRRQRRGPVTVRRRARR